MIRHLPLSLAIVAFVSQAAPAAARDAIPAFDATCPGGIEVRAPAGGPITVNGRTTRQKKFNDSYYEASDARTGTTISLTLVRRGKPAVSYAGRHGAQGVCRVVRWAAAGGPAGPAGGTPARPTGGASRVAEQACLAEVAGKSGLSLSSLSVSGVSDSGGGFSITIELPGGKAPWKCLVDRAGRVQDTSQTGS